MFGTQECSLIVCWANERILRTVRCNFSEEGGKDAVSHRDPLSGLYFGPECSDLQFLIHEAFPGCHCPGKGHPFSPSPSTFRISRHIPCLLRYVNEGAACGLEGAPFCERQKEKDPIHTKNLDQRTFYYKTRSFLKTVNMMNFSLQRNLWR